jgi:hypothetical protein
VSGDNFREFPDFGPAFEPQPPLTVGAYLVLLNLTERAPEAVAIVARCLDEASNSQEQIKRLLSGGLGWRPQLVGCVALLAADPTERPMQELHEAACSPSWVAPQLLTTLSLLGSRHTLAGTEGRITDREDPKAAAALAALLEDPSPALVELATRDADGGADIARRWRSGIAAAFDEAGLSRSW